jgi:alkylation response protein AidB-like acyl-CoA dehydrogenase
MDFELSPDQKLVQEMVREFAEKELKERAALIDQSQEFPWDNIKKMAKLGLLGVVVPEEYGGGGMDFDAGSGYRGNLESMRKHRGDCRGKQLAGRLPDSHLWY